MRLAVMCACAVMLCPLAAAAQEVRFPPPSLRIGEFRADLHVRLHLDFRALDSDPEVAPDEFDFRRFRVSLEGRLYDDLEYEVDASLLDSENPWRDVFLNYRKFRTAEVRAGKFKMPFGLDQLTSEFSHNFIERSLIGTQIAPGRDKGVMAHGRVAGDRMRYYGGWFLHDGDNMQFIEDLDQNEFLEDPPVDNTIAGRVELTPWEPTRGLLRRLQFGGAFTRGVVDDGLFSMRGRTVREFTFFEPMYVSGERIRLGVDAQWTPGPFSVSAEYNRLTDQRNGQGVGDVDLPDVIAQGWYIAGTWALTG